MTKVILTNYDERDYLSLTDDQLRLLEWLQDQDFLPYGLEIEIIGKEEIVFKKI